MMTRSTVDAKAFSAALAQVSKVLKRGTIPVLSEVLVQFSDGRCILTATDLNIWLTTAIPAQGDDFSFVFRRTRDVAKACHLFDGDLTLEVTDTGEGKDRKLTLCMRSGERMGEFHAMVPEDYPERPHFEAEAVFTANAAALLSRVERVSYAAMRPSSSTQASKCSVQFSGHRLFALDGYRLACDTDETLAFPRPFMVWEEALSYLSVFGTQELPIELGKNWGLAAKGNAAVMFRLIEGEVYPVDGACPKEFRETFLVSPKALLRELKYLKEFTANERKHYVRFRGGELVMPTVCGKYRTSVAIYGKNEITFAFELRYMVDAMRQFREEPQVKVRIQSEVGPIVIEAEGRQDFALVCPVRLSERLLAA